MMSRETYELVAERLEEPDGSLSDALCANKLVAIGYLQRHEDVSGVSGPGRVATVVQFPDKVTVYWTVGTVHQLEIFDSIEDVLKIHGHEGKTTVVWV